MTCGHGSLLTTPYHSSKKISHGMWRNPGKMSSKTHFLIISEKSLFWALWWFFLFYPSPFLKQKNLPLGGKIRILPAVFYPFMPPTTVYLYVLSILELSITISGKWLTWTIFGEIACQDCWANDYFFKESSMSLFGKMTPLITAAMPLNGSGWMVEREGEKEESEAHNGGVNLTQISVALS